jgi:hypothetical protein
MTLDARAVEPGQCPAQQVDRYAFLLIRQHLDIGEPYGVVDGYLEPVVSDASRTALLPIAFDALTQHAEVGQPFDVDAIRKPGPSRS